MNVRFKLHYLTGGDKTFGPNYGGAAIFTNTRAHYGQDCPNVYHLLNQLHFTTVEESEWMGKILDDHLTAKAMAAEWVSTHSEIIQPWIAGVTDFNGQPASLNDSINTENQSLDFEGVIKAHKLPIGENVTLFVDWTKHHGRGFFDGLSLIIRGTTDGLLRAFHSVPAPLFILLSAGLTYLLRRSLSLALFVIVALAFIVNQGYWDATLETLSLVLVAAFTATIIGVPIGIWASYQPRVFESMQPLLDLMQTLPTFVYLTPTLVLFGLGVVPGLISTVIFALPAPIRLTHLGISQVPQSLIEAGDAFGATRWQRLIKIELPAAAPSISAGISQAIMLSLSMVVIAALVGAGGLGVPVVRALNTVQVGMGFEAGLAIVLLAIVLDRMFKRESQGFSS
jgi:choline ABC transporter permease protein